MVLNYRQLINITLNMIENFKLRYAYNKFIYTDGSRLNGNSGVAIITEEQQEFTYPAALTPVRVRHIVYLKP